MAQVTEENEEPFKNKFVKNEIFFKTKCVYFFRHFFIK